MKLIQASPETHLETISGLIQEYVELLHQCAEQEFGVRFDLMQVQQMFLDSPTFFTVSHSLYESRGFEYIGPYQGSEAAATQPDLFVFMELALRV